MICLFHLQSIHVFSQSCYNIQHWPRVSFYEQTSDFIWVSEPTTRALVSISFPLYEAPLVYIWLQATKKGEGKKEVELV